MYYSKFANFPRLLKHSAIVVVFLLVLLLGLLAVLPGIANTLMVKWFKQQGLTAQIETIDIDYNDGFFTLLNLDAKNPQQQGFHVDRLLIQFSWQSLLKKKIQLSNIRLAGIKLQSRSSHGQLDSIAGFLLTEPAQQQATTETASSTSGGWEIELGDIHLQELDACHTQAESKQTLCLQINNIDWRGNFNLALHPSTSLQFGASGNLLIDNVMLQDAQQVIFSQQRLSLKTLKLNNNELVAQILRLDELRLFPSTENTEATALSQFRQLNVTGISYQNQKLTLNKVYLNGIGATIRRDKNAQWEFVQRLNTLFDQTATVGTKTPNDDKQISATPSIIVDELRIDESLPIVFTDASLKRPVNIAAQLITLRVKNINTADANQLSQLEIDLVTDKHSTIKITGSIQLLAKTHNFNLDGEVRGLDLRPVGSYLENELGHRIKSGQLSAKLKLVAKDGQLDSLLDVELQQLQLKKPSADDEEITQEIGMPLSTALNLLRDRDNSIKLKIPVTGDLAAPDFDPSDAIQKASTKAITNAAISYYTPFGLVTVVEGLINLATAIRFEPVTFIPGTTTFTADQQDYLAKIQHPLAEKPHLHLTLCGFSNRDDLLKVDPQLKNQLEQADFKLDKNLLRQLTGLANQRATLVKDFLVNKGISADRLVICEGEYQAKEISGVKLRI